MYSISSRSSLFLNQHLERDDKPPPPPPPPLPTKGGTSGLQQQNWEQLNKAHVLLPEGCTERRYGELFETGGGGGQYNSRQILLSERLSTNGSWPPGFSCSTFDAFSDMGRRPRATRAIISLHEKPKSHSDQSSFQSRP